MVHKKEEATCHHIEKLTKDMPGFLSPGKGVPLLLIPEYSGVNKDQRIPDRSKTAHRKPPVKCFLTQTLYHNRRQNFLFTKMSSKDRRPEDGSECDGWKCLHRWPDDRTGSCRPDLTGVQPSHS